jgi:predicted RNA-binding Zn-ribbon protein involved in translation (DUF1610 family)
MILRTFRILTILLMTVVTAFLMEEAAEACVCGVLGMDESYSSAATVFIGKVESVTRQFEGRVKPQDEPPVRDGRMKRFSLSGISRPVTTFSVSTVFTGPKMIRLEYKGRGTNCDFRFTPGESYLIYAAPRDGGLEIDRCVRIRLLSEAAEEVKHLESLRAGRPPALIAGTVSLGQDDVPGPFKSEEPVHIIVRGGGRSYSARVGSDGQFYLAVPPGEYEIWPEQRGKRLLPARTVTLADGETVRPTFVIHMP